MANDVSSATRRVTADEALEILGISRRTLQRWLRIGTISGLRVGRQLLVDIPTDAITSQTTTPRDTRRPVSPNVAPELDSARHELAALRQNLSARDLQLAELRHQLELAQAEVAHLHSELATAQAERDYLRQALAASLTVQQRLLPERATGSRPWWQIWTRR